MSLFPLESIICPTEDRHRSLSFVVFLFLSRTANHRSVQVQRRAAWLQFTAQQVFLSFAVCRLYLLYRSAPLPCQSGYFSSFPSPSSLLSFFISFLHLSFSRLYRFSPISFHFHGNFDSFPFTSIISHFQSRFGLFTSQFQVPNHVTLPCSLQSVNVDRVLSVCCLLAILTLSFSISSSVFHISVCKLSSLSILLYAVPVIVDDRPIEAE